MKELEVLVEEVMSIAKKAGFEVKIISYPRDQRSIDIAGLRDTKKVLIKVTPDTKHLTNTEYNDLKKASSAYNASPLIIAEKLEQGKIEDDVVIKKKGLNIVSITMFKNYLEGKAEPLVYLSHGTYLVKINPTVFRKKREEELGYSLGELAEAVGVSRKTIYEYEWGSLDATLDVAIRLAEIMGEDIFQPIDLLNEKVSPENVESDTPQNRYEKYLHDMCREYTQTICRFYRLMKTPIDYVLRIGERSIAIIRKLRGEDFEIKAYEGITISQIMRGEYVIDESADIEKIKKELKRMPI